MAGKVGIIGAGQVGASAGYLLSFTPGVREVVLVDLEIARKLSREVEHPVLAERLQHVAEKPDRAVDVARPRPVKIKRKVDVGLVRLPLDYHVSFHIKNPY